MDKDAKETTESVLITWGRLQQHARDTLLEAAEESAGRDPGGLLILARWLASEAVEALTDEQFLAVAVMLRTPGNEPDDHDDRPAFGERLYEGLFDTLRYSGWLV